jgi:uncharacterized protein YbjT (DUF2867 family)
MRVTVFGASGAIGQHVVSQLLEGGHQVAAVVRDSSRSMPHPSFTLYRVPGLEDPAALVPALQGSDAAISTVGPRRMSDGPVASTATRAIVAAMAEAGVERIVAISAAPAGSTPPGEGFLLRYVLTPLMSVILRDLYRDLRTMERIMADSGLAWTAVRPPRLTNGPLTCAYRTTIGGNVANGYTVSRADVAHLMCAALTDPTTVGRALGIAA